MTEVPHRRDAFARLATPCMRALGHSVTICACKTADGFLPCPPEMQGKLTPVYPPAAYAAARKALAAESAVVVDTPPTSAETAEKAPPPAPPRLVYSAPDTHMIARQSGYTGNICDVCQSPNMRRNGTCEVCENCGATSGCS